ncbi:MAG: transposase [Deltaproteobacteria bacterium]|nr:transposase [Deltaproteobacteria bacterium]
MNVINATPALPELQYCDPKTFFAILDRIDLTALKNAVIGPERRGPKLKDPDAIVRLFLWHLWCLGDGADDQTTVAGLRRELEDTESALINLCRFDKTKALPTRRTIANHFGRISRHPDPVREVLAEINQLVSYTPFIKPSAAAKKADEETNGRKGSDPKNRDEENVDYRRRRRREAIGDREIKPVLDDPDQAEDFMSTAIHGDRPKCHKCVEKTAQGWTCAKDHVHGVVVEMTRKPGEGRRWKCRCCGYQLSVTAGTVFHGTNFSCQEILMVLRYMAHFRHGITAQDVAGFLNEYGRDVSEGAVRMLMHRLRECMKEKIFERFQGETEIDEMLLRVSDDRFVSILTAYNRPTGRVRFKIIERESRKKPKANKREMIKFIRETTVRDSIILSDSDAAILKITDAEMGGRKRGSVNHKKRRFVIWSDLNGILEKPIEVGSNRAESTHGFLRRTLAIRNGISRHHLDRYLLEAAWRINHLRNQMESLAHDREERRNLTLMRDVLAGAAGRKVTLQDLSGEPQKKRAASSRRKRTAPVVPDDNPEQPPLLPSGLTVPGAQQPDCRQLKPKPGRSEPAQIRWSPAPDDPTQRPLPMAG